MAEVIKEDFFFEGGEVFLSLCCLLKDINSILTNYSGFFFVFVLFVFVVFFLSQTACHALVLTAHCHSVNLVV